MEMFVSKIEKEFFETLLQPQFIVLEYGSGGSTLLIQERVNKLFSIEHQEEWYKKINSLIKSNTKLFFVPPDKKYVEGGHDGSYNEFYNYINKGLEYGPYNLVYVDGRARVDCCRRIKHKLTSDGIIVIHDFERNEYKCLLKEFNIVDQKERMAILRPI